MTTKYFAILTNQGAARLANATALGTKLNITQMAVGDGGGTLPTPDPAQTKLVNQTRIAPINSLGVDANDAGQIIAEQIIPENEGGFFIREIGLYDDDGVLIAVANCPETYKPLLAEGSGRTQTIRMILVVSSTSALTLKIDPSVVLATRKYVDDAVIEVKGYADKLMKDHEAKANPHKQYPLIENALKEMADAGLIDKVLENLGLSEGAPMIGTPIPWPSEIMPSEIFPNMKNMVFLKHNGAAFDPEIYPLLGKVYPNGVVKDLRGEFIRGWDDGRGIDTGRTILSSQSALVAGHAHTLERMWAASDETGTPSKHLGASKGIHNTTKETMGNGIIEDVDTSLGIVVGYGGGGALTSTSAIKSNSSSTDNRPRNIAFNYIVRAA